MTVVIPDFRRMPRAAIRDWDTRGFNVAPVNDPGWKVWTAHLLAFLGEPRNWGALFAWAIEREIGDYRIRHMVAYLAFTDQAVFDDTDKTWRRE